jgi:hypothetical protein
VPFDPQTRKGDTHGPGKLVLTVAQIKKPWFKQLARTLWKAGKAHLIPWIWKICGETGEDEAIKALELLENRKRTAAQPSGSRVGQPAPESKPSPSPDRSRESGSLSQRLLKGMKPTPAAKNAPED